MKLSFASPRWGEAQELALARASGEDAPIPMHLADSIRCRRESAARVAKRRKRRGR
jgi:hypothetical protein